MKKILLQIVLVLAAMLNSARSQTQFIANGGFELVNGGEWQITGAGALLTSGPAAASGTGYLSMGNIANASQAVFQTVTLPTNLIAATFSFNYAIVTTDAFASDDVLSVYLLDTNHNTLASFGSGNNTSSAANAGYFAISNNLVVYSSPTNVSSYAGQTVEVYFQ